MAASPGGETPGTASSLASTPEGVQAHVAKCLQTHVGLQVALTRLERMRRREAARFAVSLWTDKTDLPIEDGWTLEVDPAWSETCAKWKETDTRLNEWIEALRDDKGLLGKIEQYLGELEADYPLEFATAKKHELSRLSRACRRLVAQARLLEKRLKWISTLGQKVTGGSHGLHPHL